MKVRPILWRAAAGIVLAGGIIAVVLSLARERGWVEPSVPGGVTTVRLISAEQYLSAIQDLFGEDIEVEANFFPPPQRRQGLLALGASAAVITPGALEQFDRAARMIAIQVIDETRRPMLVSCTPASVRASDVACAKKFFARVGRLLYRRPLTETELEMQVATAGAVAEGVGDFYTGLAYSLAGMLTSPKFLYITELTEPDPEHPGQVRLDAYGKASRLSLLLWNALPDEALLEAAEAGELHKARGLERQIERLLASPRLEAGVRAFFADMLHFSDFDTLAKDPMIYPVFTRDVAHSAKEQALQLISDHLLTRQGDYRDLFTTSRAFVDATLGPLYRAPVPTPQDWIAYELDRDHSAGLLTSLSFLALHSHPGRSSPTLRGKAIRELLLCQKVPEPPPNVNFANFEDPNSQFKTARERIQAHSTEPVCAGCHKITDPMGLALENFDGAGQFRAEENGVLIDPSGELDGQPFTDVAGLGRAMRENPALAPCLVNRLSAYGLGRELSVADRPWLTHLGKRFAVHGYRVPELLREIASSRAFYAVSGESPIRDHQGPPSPAIAAADIQLKDPS